MADEQHEPFWLKDVPGKATVEVRVVPEEQRPKHRLQDGREMYTGVPLRVLREHIGGHTGEVQDPQSGQKIAIDLTPWADADPDRTYVVLGFQFLPDLPIAPEHRHHFP